MPALPAEYARLNRVVHPGGANVQIQYSHESEVTSLIDELGRASLWNYDSAGWLTSYRNPRNDLEIYSYDQAGRLNAVQNGRNFSRTYTYLTRGDLRQLTMPDGGVEEWLYDGEGNDTRYQNSLFANNYEFDGAGRLTRVDYPSGTDTTFTYDFADRLLTMLDSSGTTSWTWDLNDRLHELVSPQGTTRYFYNVAGQRTRMTHVGVGDTTYDYDTSGRVWRITNPFGEITSWVYDNSSRVTRQKYASGAFASYGYDNRDRLTSVVHRRANNSTITSETYTYNAARNLITRLVDGITTYFTYDGADQLLTETRPGYSAAYTYDGNGNRLTRTVNSVQEAYTYDAGDKLTQIAGGLNPRTFTYDALGRTTAVTTGAGTTTLAYDFESRIVSIVGPGIAGSYGYNGLDTRLTRMENGVSRSFLRDGAYVIDPVLSDGAAVYTPAISERRGGVTTYTHSGLKNTEIQTSSAQAITATRRTDAFGNLLSSSGSWQGPFGYAGDYGYQQDASGLMLLGHRYYDSATGRFLTRDPIRDGRNWYGYGGGGGAPTLFADPVGLAPSLDSVNASISQALLRATANPREAMEMLRFLGGMLGLTPVMQRKINQAM